MQVVPQKYYKNGSQGFHVKREVSYTCRYWKLDFFPSCEKFLVFLLSRLLHDWKLEQETEYLNTLVRNHRSRSQQIIGSNLIVLLSWAVLFMFNVINTKSTTKQNLFSRFKLHLRCVNFQF